MNAGEQERQVCRAVDQLLLEQGTYTPLELLLQEGRLLYTDYEAWRSGEAEYLEERLFGDPAQIRTLLERGAAYAAKLGLEAETLQYTRWGGENSGRLRFSPQPAFERLFHTGYRRPADLSQLDLFMDAAGVILVNGITGALKGRDNSEAQRLLGRLFDTEPGHPQIGDLELLVTATERLSQPVVDAAAELDNLERELVPVADERLDAGSRDYLAPFWQRLLGALQAVPFDPARPNLHASYVALRLRDWNLVQRRIESEPGWAGDPLLLRRYAQAAGQLQQREAVLCCGFRLCWRFPDQADAIDGEAGPFWDRYWQRFLDLEPPLGARDFPAWLVMQQPGLLPGLEKANCTLRDEAPEDYLATAELVAGGTGETAPAGTIELRRQLQRLNPGLFAHYLSHFA